MRLPVSPRSELDALRRERDAWRRRAESALHEETPEPEHGVVRRSRNRVRRLLATSFLTVVAVLSAGLLFGQPGAARLPDYPACIGKARYEHPIQGNQYQELVNALYSCEVYSSG
jgi:hypothetical protein